MAWQTVSPAFSNSWTTTSAATPNWSDHGIVPSGESRLNRVFPQSIVTQEDLSYVWRIQSEGPFLVASGNGVYIRSGITEQF